MFFTWIGNEKNLEMIDIRDTSYKCDENLIGCDLIFIKEVNSSRASLVYWKTKRIQKVSHSSKDEETLNVLMLVDTVYISRQVEMLLYGDIKERIIFRFFMDSEPTLESIVQSRQVERKLLRINVKELKDKCLEGVVLSYAWLPTKEMMVNCLTKELTMPTNVSGHQR